MILPVKKFISYLLPAITLLMLLQSCQEDEGIDPSQNPYLLKIMGKWLAYKEIHESIRKNSIDTLSVLESNDTNLLVFTDTYLLTYYIYPADSSTYITEFYKSMTDSVFYFGGYPFNTGEVLYVDDSNLVFKRFKGWYVPMDTQDTIHHLVIYYCRRFAEDENL